MKGPSQKKPNGPGPAPVKSRRTSQVTRPPPAAGQRGPTPEEVISNARARVSKLEAAMAAVGVGPDVQCFTRSFEESSRPSSSAQSKTGSFQRRVFIERAKKRVNVCREEVSRAQEALAQAQTKLQSEEQGLVDGEARLAALIQESATSVEEPPPTSPANFATNSRSCAFAFRHCNERTTICDPSCSPPEDQIALRRRAIQALPVIWRRYPLPSILQRGSSMLWSSI